MLSQRDRPFIARMTALLSAGLMILTTALIAEGVRGNKMSATSALLSVPTLILSLTLIHLTRKFDKALLKQIWSTKWRYLVILSAIVTVICVFVCGR